jgi:anti-sigma B factor antagonist
MLLSLTTRMREPGITVIELNGRITLGRESSQIEAAVLKALNEGAHKLIVDMSGVTYIDSTGIGIIAYCFGRMNQKGAKGAVAGANGLVLDVFKLTRIDSVVSFYPDLDAAVAALNAGAQSA